MRIEMIRREEVAAWEDERVKSEAKRGRSNSTSPMTRRPHSLPQSQRERRDRRKRKEERDAPGSLTDQTTTNSRVLPLPDWTSRMTDSAMERAKETPDPPATTRTEEKREETKAAWP
jgi:polynucleotide 5'-kinase involved in rRNA processing